MKRVLLGSLFVFIFHLGFTPVTQAAEIPPTAECTSTFKTLIKAYNEATSGRTTAKERRQADKDLVNGLAEADCVSDPKPLLKEMDAKPFTAECVAAAGSADDFWSPLTKEVKVLFKEHSKTVRPLNRRIAKIAGKIRKLRKSDGPVRQIKRLDRKRKTLRAIADRRESQLEKRFLPILAENAHASTLVFYELVSLRCFGIDVFIADGTKGPAIRALSKNGIFVWPSLFFLAFDSTEFEAGVARSSSSPDPAGLADAVDGFREADSGSLPLLP